MSRSAHGFRHAAGALYASGALFSALSCSSGTATPEGGPGTTFIPSTAGSNPGVSGAPGRAGSGGAGGAGSAGAPAALGGGVAGTPGGVAGAAAGGAPGSAGSSSPIGGAPSASGASAGGSPASGAGSSSVAGTAGTGPVIEAPATVKPGACKQDLGGYQNGSVTYYWFDQGTKRVNCEYDEISRNPDRVQHVLTNNGNYFGAMNTADYNTAAMCGACVEITRDGSRKVTITIADRCPVESNPKCKKGHIDISREAFDQLGSRGSEGYLGTGNGGERGQISWKYVPCPTGSNVSFRLKESDNLYWNQVLVAGHRYPIEKVEVLVDGAWVATTRQMYNYWEPPNEGKMGEPGGPYRVRVTDANGSVLEAPVRLMAGDQDSGVQFSCE